MLGQRDSLVRFASRVALHTTITVRLTSKPAGAFGGRTFLADIRPFLGQPISSKTHPS
jgi:hypothetical protein